MKATGIVRRIDDLGRVVIPKEIRRVLHIKEGDPLEIYTDKDGEVIFKKYSPMGEVLNFAAQLCETLAKTTGMTVAITDRDTIIAIAGQGRRELSDKRVGENVAAILDTRQSYQHKENNKRINVCDEVSDYYVSIVVPIMAEGDLSGAVILISQDSVTCGEMEYKLAATIASFLGKQMDG